MESPVESAVQPSSITDLSALLLLVHTPDREKWEIWPRVEPYVARGSRGWGIAQAWFGDTEPTLLQVSDLCELRAIAGLPFDEAHARQSIHRTRAARPAEAK